MLTQNKSIYSRISSEIFMFNGIRWKITSQIRNTSFRCVYNFISKSCTKVIDSTLLRLLSPIMFDSFFCFSSAGFLVDHGQCGIGVESDQAETEFTTHYRHSATVFD